MGDINPLVRVGELTFDADDETLTREVRAMFDPAARIRLNGKESDVGGYLRHVLELRSAMSEGAMTVAAALRAGDGGSDQVAARVVVRMAMRDGSVLHGESHLVGQLGDDGRITRMVEIGRALEAGDDPA
jgi:uncharacterized membrane-anchored protein